MCDAGVSLGGDGAKVGNVHRAADFADLTFADFAVSARSPSAPRWKRRGNRNGASGARCDHCHPRQVVATNTNLGMVLLLAPLATVPRADLLSTANVRHVLMGLTPDDSRLIYEAIRLAQPGGLGKVE